MDDPVDTFAPAKLRRPEPSIELIERPGVMAMLQSIGQAALTCVTAPAGYGKTVSVSQWAAARASTTASPVAWLRLDPDDEAPWRLLTGLLAAVAVARPELRTPTWPEPGPLAIERWLTRRLLVPLAEHGGSLVIVFDGTEVSGAGALASMLRWLLENRGPTLHLCVIGREPLDLPLARIEAQGELARIGVEQLRLTSDELRALARVVLERDPSDNELGWLEQTSRGWPVAARLLAQAIHEGRMAPREAVDRRVLAYMIEEVLDRLSSGLQRMLIATAILDELEGDACVAVTGEADAGDRLWSALDSGLLVGTGASATVHPLLREALLNRFAQTPEDQRRALHCRASRFFAERGRLELALRHGVAGADVPGLAKLAHERGWTLLRAGQLDGLGRLIAAVDEAGPLDDAAGDDRASVAVLRAWSTLAHGAHATRIALAQARAAVPAEDVEGQADVLLRSLAALEALVELRSGEVEAGLARARSALAGLDEGERGLAVVLHLAIGLASEMKHEWTGALEALAHAGLDAAIAPALPSLATITAHRVRLLRRLARVREAAELGDAGRAVLERLGWAHSPAAGQLAIELALVELDRGRPDEAERAAQRGLAAVELGGDPAAHVRGLIALARVRRARSDADADEVAEALALAEARCDAAQLGWLKLLVAAEADPFAVSLEQAAALGPLGALLVSEIRVARGLAWLRNPTVGAERSELIRELEHELASADAEGRRGAAVYARVLLAALLIDSDRREAEALLGVASAVAEPEQLRGPFLAAREQLAALAAGASPWLAAMLRSEPGAAEQAEPKPPLSERERELLAEIARGLPNRLIASTLHISLATVKTHVHHILAKLEVRNRTEAVHRARTLKLLD